jgi:flagellar assembly protein FliH
MGLIKSSNSPASLQPFSMRDIEAQARALLLRAQQQADQLLAEAQADAMRLRTEARVLGLEEGRAQGRAEGLAQGQQHGRQEARDAHAAELAQLVHALSNGLTEFDASRRDLEAGGLRDVVELAVAIARRVARRVGRLDPVVLTDNLRDAMKLVISESDLRIMLHPEQRQLLEQELPSLKLQWPALEHVELVDDPALLPGGCRIATRGGMVDADLNTQLDRIVQDLLPEPQEVQP